MKKLDQSDRLKLFTSSMIFFCVVIILFVHLFDFFVNFPCAFFFLQSFDYRELIYQKLDDFVFPICCCYYYQMIDLVY